MSAANAERAALRARWPNEFNNGARAAFQQCDRYPTGFNSWPLDRRNSWWSGYNVGRLDRLRDEAERARG